MALDIATLGIEIDTSSLDAAVKKLGEFADAADRAADASADLAGGSRKSQAGLEQYAQATRKAQTSTEKHIQAMRKAEAETGRFATSVEGLADDAVLELDRELQNLGASLADLGRANPQVSAQMDKLADRLRGLTEEAKKCDAEFGHLGEGAQSAGEKTSGFMDRLKGLSGGGFMLMGLREIAGGIEGVINAYLQFEQATSEAKQRLEAIDSGFRTAFGGQATHLLESVKKQCDELGLGFQATAELARDFFQQGSGTPIAAEMDKVFASLTTAGKALNFTDEQLKGLMKDVGDLAQQETVSISDLAEKLGSHLPDALEKSASAMGLTIGEMNTLASQGKLLSGELLPQLASALRDEYAQAAAEAADTVEGMTMRMGNAWEQFKANLAASGPAKFVVQFIAEGLETINAGMAAFDKNKALVNQLKSAGIEEAGVATHRFGFGSVEQKHYTEEQLANMDMANQALAAGASIAEKLAKKGQQALVDLNATHEKTRAAKKDSTQTLIDKTKSDFEAAKSYLKSTGASEADIKALEKQKDQTIKELSAQQERLAKLMNGSGGKSAKSAASAAQKASVAEANYTAKLQATEAQLAKLEAQAGKTGSVEQSLALERTRIEEEYQAQLAKNAKEYASLSGKMKAGELEQYKVANDKVALMERDLKLRQAEKSATEKNAQITQGQIRFYKELGKLSGNYGNSIELQNQLIRKQAAEFENTYGISHELAEEWVRLQELEISEDAFDGVTRGLLKFNAEYRDSASQWEDIAHNFGKSFMSTTRNIFDDFIDTGKASFDSFKSLFKQLLKDIAWQAIANPIMVSIVGGVTGALYGGSAAQAQAQGVAQAGTASSGSGGIVDLATGAMTQYATGQIKNQIFGSTSGIMGGITSYINSTVANMFPSMFASSSAQAIGNVGINAGNAVALKLGTGGTSAALPTTTFTSTLGVPAIGAGIGALASPFVNSMLGLENNTGSSIGSLVGGGLGTVGGAVAAGALAGSAIPGLGTIVGAGLGALGSLIGGGIGSLFGGGQKKKKPKLEVDMTSYLWRPLGDEVIFETGAGRPARSVDSWGTATADAEGTRGAGGWQDETAKYLGQVTRSVVEQSWAIADSLGGINDAMKEQYLGGLEKQGPISMHNIWEGDYIKEEHIEEFAEDFVRGAIEHIVIALGEVDLKPLTRAADGFAVRTVEDMGNAFTQIAAYINQASAIEDEDLKATFISNSIGQMKNALADVSFEPLAVSADKWAKNAVETVNESLANMFSLYDISEAIEDESAKKVFQSWAQEQIVTAFADKDLSGVRVDYDRDSFAGMQQLYAATQAWQTVTKSIDDFLNPAAEVETQLNAASDQFGQWIENLRQLGWQEEALAEIEAKRGTYMAELRRQLESEAQQNLSLRLTSLKYGSDSYQYGWQSLRYQQANELESVKQKFGESSMIYNTTVKAQQAEATQYKLEYLRQQAAKREQQELQREQQNIAARQQALQKEITARQQEVTEANRLVTAFQRVVKSLEEFRRDLWTGQDNLSGSRYQDSRSQFDELYRKALAGDEDAYNQLEGKASELLGLGREQLATYEEYNSLFYDVDQKLKEAQLNAQKELEKAESQVAALESQIAALERQQESLNRQLEELQSQSETMTAQLEQDELANLSLEQIDAGIANLEAVLQAQTQELAQAYQNAFGYNWEQRILDTINAHNQTSYLGNDSWTREEVMKEITSRGLRTDEWYAQIQSITKVQLEAANTTNATIDREIGNLNQNVEFNIQKSTDTLNNDLVLQYNESLIQGQNLATLLLTQSTNWPLALTRMDNMTTSIVAAIDAMGNRVASAVSSAIAAAERAAAQASLDRYAAQQATKSTPTSLTKKYATGGIAPVNEAFIVGERGPEMMIASRRFGVLNDRATEAILSENAPAMPVIYERKSDDGNREELEEMLALLAQILVFIKQNVVKADEAAYLMRQLRDLSRARDFEEASGGSR